MQCSKRQTIELVDLPPQDLIARLSEGKVYAPQMAGRAREAFPSLAT